MTDARRTVGLGSIPKYNRVVTSYLRSIILIIFGIRGTDIPTNGTGIVPKGSGIFQFQISEETHSCRHPNRTPTYKCGAIVLKHGSFDEDMVAIRQVNSTSSLNIDHG
jgi:hypothetical protein